MLHRKRNEPRISRLARIQTASRLHSSLSVKSASSAVLLTSLKFSPYEEGAQPEPRPSDIINLAHGYPGGEGLEAGEDYYVEGSTMTITPASPLADMVEVSFNVSPAAYYLTDVFGT